MIASLSLLGQKFPAQGGPITDFGGGFYIDTFPITVTGLPNRIDEGFGLAEVCISIGHERISDLKVSLVSPDGTAFWLTNRNGGDEGKDYQSVCFRSNGFSGYIHRASVP